MRDDRMFTDKKLVEAAGVELNMDADSKQVVDFYSRSIR